jgi:hypothetical protein
MQLTLINNLRQALMMVKAFVIFFADTFFSFANANKHFIFKKAFVRHASKHA